MAGTLRTDSYMQPPGRSYEVSAAFAPCSPQKPERPLQTSPRPCHPSALNPSGSHCSQKNSHSCHMTFKAPASPHLITYPPSLPFTLLCPQWLSFFPSDPDLFLPQGVCTCCPPCPNAFPPEVRIAGTFSPVTTHVNCLPQPPYLNSLDPPHPHRSPTLILLYFLLTLVSP